MPTWRRGEFERQLRRADSSVKDAQAAGSAEDFDRHLIAGFTFARAAMEIALVELPSQKSTLDEIAHAELVRRVRVHDFHRRPLSFWPPASARYIEISGPIVLKAKNGGAFMTLGPKGVEFVVSGDSSYADGDLLQFQDGYVLDPKSSDWVKPVRALQIHLAALDAWTKELPIR